MSRDCGNVPKSRKHLSASNPSTKPSRKTFQGVSESSSLSSNRNSPAQSDDDWYYSNQAVKNVTEEEKDEMLKKLQCQVKELRNKFIILVDCIENKDCAIGTVTREKNKILGEMRRLERSNKQLKQQLNDERSHYLEEKEKFCEEMTKYKKRLQEMKMAGDSRYLRGPVSIASKISAGTWQKGDSAEVNPGNDASGNIGRSEFKKSTSVDSVALYPGQDLSLQMAALRTENAKLKAIITEREERNYELCLRFLRMKLSKNDLRNRFQDLEQEYLQVITNLMEKIDEARDEFNFIIDQKFKMPLHSTNAKYIRMVQKNSKMAHENVALRMELQSMRKELSKGNIGEGDCISRKLEKPKKSNSDSKPKTSMKIAGVRQMKSDGNLLPKASDTDSNYMSKTSTTEPSTGSNGGGKSSESMCNESLNMKNKTLKIQNPLFSDDILQKIFELVDTQSNSNTPGQTEKGNPLLQKLGSKQGKVIEYKELTPVPLEGVGKRYVECTLNAKRFHEITVHGAAKKTIATSKEKAESPIVEAYVEKKKSDEVNEPRRKPSDSSVRSRKKSQYNALKERVRPIGESTKPQELQKENVSLKSSYSWDRIKDEDKIFHPRQYKPRTERRQRFFIGDSCGLEEKLDTDGEVSPDNDIETTTRTPKNGRLIDQLALVKHRIPDNIRSRIWHETQRRLDKDMNSDDSAIGSSGARVRNRNSISLHDELMEATKSLSQTDDPFWRRELNLHSLITKKSASSSRTYRLTGRKSRFLSEERKTPNIMDDDEGENMKDVDVGVGTMDEERSRSVSPFERNAAECEREMPPNVTHQTSADPMDSEVVLHFLMPPATILSTQSLIYDENCKEPSLRGKGQGSPPQSFRQLMISASNAQSSCTTVDLAQSSPTRENGLTSRTLSAPALIESEWFNNSKLCEMKDCSTNT